MTFGLGMAAGIPTLMLNVYQGLGARRLPGAALQPRPDRRFPRLALDPRHHRVGRADPAGGRRPGDRREDPVSGPLRADRQSRAARPAGGADGGRRHPDAVRGRHPGGRLSPAGGEHAAALRHRIEHRRAVDRLFQPLRQERRGDDACPRAHLAILRRRAPARAARSSRPKGVPIPVELADYGERLSRLRHRLGDLDLGDHRHLPADHPLDRQDRQHPARDLDRAVHRLHDPQSLLRLFRARLAGRDAGQARGRPAGDRPPRRPVAALRRHRPQSHARGRDVPAARSPADGGPGCRRRGRLGAAFAGDLDAVLRSCSRSSTATACAAAT